MTRHVVALGGGGFSMEETPALDGCLAILPGSFCPHYNNEGRRPTYRRLVDAGELAPGFAADDSCAVHFVDEQVFEIVRSREGAGVYRVEPGNETRS